MCVYGSFWNLRLYLYINKKVMRKTDSKRINIWVDHALYNQIKKSAEESFLKVGTYTRQLIQTAMKNNITKN